jgi:hypothetical protein
MENEIDYNKLTIDQLRLENSKEHDLFLEYLQSEKKEKMKETTEKIGQIMRVIGEKLHVQGS